MNCRSAPTFRLLSAGQIPIRPRVKMPDPEIHERPDLGCAMPRRRIDGIDAGIGWNLFHSAVVEGEIELDLWMARKEEFMPRHPGSSRSIVSPGATVFLRL